MPGVSNGNRFEQISRFIPREESHVRIPVYTVSTIELQRESVEFVEAGAFGHQFDERKQSNGFETLGQKGNVASPRQSLRRPAEEKLPAEKRGLAPGLPGACPPFSRYHFVAAARSSVKTAVPPRNRVTVPVD